LLIGAAPCYLDLPNWAPALAGVDDFRGRCGQPRTLSTRRKARTAYVSLT